MQCYRHPRVETAVSCGKCDRPLCTNCMVAGPAGMRCRDCASLRSSALYQIPPARLAMATAAGLLTGIVGAYLMTALGFFVFFVGPIYGGVVAEAVLRATGRKRGRVLEVIGVGSIVLGALLVCALPLLRLAVSVSAAHAGAPPNGPVPPPELPGAFFGVGLISFAWPLVGFALAISACYARLKYL